MRRSRVRTTRADTARIRPATLPVIALLVGLSGCAHRPATQVAPPPQLADCQTRLLAADDQAASGDQGDAARRRVDGFPHYRQNRLLASWRDETLDAHQWASLSAALLNLGNEARAIEAARQGLQPDPALTKCAARLRDADLQSPPRRAALLARLGVADDYSQGQRLAGGYWLARPFLKAGIAGFHATMAKRFSATSGNAGQLTRYRPEPAPEAEAAAPTHAWRIDPLGLPQLDDAQWQALARHHAPHWWVETATDDDRAVAPDRNADGDLVTTPRAVVYWHPTLTRWGDQVLPGLVYTLWFPARTASGAFDPYAGTLDGIVWRVVLDNDGQPLAYDSIHPCGCYHYAYPAQALTPQPQDNPGQERVLIPQSVDGSEPLALRVSAGDHQLLRVMPATSVVSDAEQTYALRPYRELEVGTLFDDDGLIRGTERGERWWLWPSGVISPGAMRQWGRHATAFIGRAHFDDPRYLERLFIPPDRP